MLSEFNARHPIVFYNFINILVLICQTVHGYIFQQKQSSSGHLALQKCKQIATAYS
jgi:hypothetical protein